MATKLDLAGSEGQLGYHVEDRALDLLHHNAAALDLKLLYVVGALPGPRLSAWND
jgi:hypothetical protein